MNIGVSETLLLTTELVEATKQLLQRSKFPEKYSRLIKNIYNNFIEPENKAIVSISPVSSMSGQKQIQPKPNRRA